MVNANRRNETDRIEKHLNVYISVVKDYIAQEF